MWSKRCGAHSVAIWKAGGSRGHNGESRRPPHKHTNKPTPTHHVSCVASVRREDLRTTSVGRRWKAVCEIKKAAAAATDGEKKRYYKVCRIIQTGASRNKTTAPLISYDHV